MRLHLILLIVLGAGPLARAQLTPEEAYQRLQERQRQRQAEQKSAASQPAGAASRPSGMQIGRMLHDGWNNLMSRHYSQGAALFERVLANDPKDTNALEGRGICKYELKQYKAAERDLEEAYKLAGKGTSKGPSRQLTIAIAAVATLTDNSMRAVRVLRGMMEPMEQDSKFDEELQNDLGIALSHANTQARKQEYFRQSLKYYMDYDKKLNEQKHDGTERWGTQWVGSSEAQEKWKKYQTASTNAEQAGATYDHVLLAEEQAHDHYLELHGLRLHGTLEIKKYLDEYNQAILNSRAAKAHLDQSIERLNKIDKPPFPERIEHNWQEPR